jgi:EF hand domain-containing protein
MKATRLLIGGVAALLPFVAAQAQTPPPPAPDSPPQQQQGATFEQLDVNGDDKISKEEAAANSNVSAQFSRYDQDGNGFIERAEVASTNHPSEPQQ